jgi:serine phosphatase RsbU (regulator of sigma subunit)
MRILFLAISIALPGILLRAGVVPDRYTADFKNSVTHDLLTAEWDKAIPYEQQPQIAVSRQDRANDSLKAAALVRRAESLAAAGNADSARYYYFEAREVCLSRGFLFTEAMIYAGLASLADQSGDWENTLRNYLRAAARYRMSRDSLPAAEVYRKIGEKYLDLDVPLLAAAHFQREYGIYSGTGAVYRAESAYRAAGAFMGSYDTINAIAWFDSARVWFNVAENSARVFTINNIAIPLLSGKGMNREALVLANRNLNALQPKSDRNGWILLNNNLGFLHFRTGDNMSALSRFEEAERLCLTVPEDKVSLISVYANMAFCYQKLGNEESMIRYFRKALEMASSAAVMEEKARIEMLLAKVYHSNGDFYNSGIYCEECIESAKASQNYEALLTCYALNADLLQKGNDPDRALSYFSKHFTLRDSLDRTRKEKIEYQRERTIFYETLERRLSLDITDEEKKELEYKRLQAETETQKIAIALAGSEIANQRAQGENLSLALNVRIKSEEALREKQKNDSLLLENVEQQLALEKSTNEERELQRRNELLEGETREKELELRNEKEARKLTLYIAILMVLVVIGALYNLFSVRRKNQKLAASKKLIEAINNDLEDKNREIILQKDVIEQKNQSITDSIQYAARIQNAVLQPPTFLSEWGIENFIYFRPKDIVSGDFYWGFRKKGRIYIAAADCTGHGVPGAFMSMLGNAFLNELLIENEFEEASGILDKLRDEIIRALRQKGVTGEARDGMDISMVMYDSKSNTIQYAGANNPIYIVRDGELIRYQADRMPIGIHVKETAPFTNHTVEISPGDCIYLFSDGYADQFGGEHGKKFMYRQFQEVLLAGASLPMEEQLARLDAAFLNWRGSYEQVDDVLVIGFRTR